MQSINESDEAPKKEGRTKNATLGSVVKAKRPSKEEEERKKKEKEAEEEKKRLALAQRQKEEEEEKQRRVEQRQKLEEAERLAQEETVRRSKQQAAEEVLAYEQAITKQAEHREQVVGVNAVAVNAALLKLVSAASEAVTAQKDMTAAVEAYTAKLYDVAKARASHDDELVIAAVREAELFKQEINACDERARRSPELLQQVGTQFDAAVAKARLLGFGSLSDRASEMAGQVLREVDERVEDSSRALADQAVMEGFCEQMAQRHQQYQESLVQLQEDANTEGRGHTGYDVDYLNLFGRP